MGEPVGGKVGGFSANGGPTTKLRLLSIEHACTGDAPTRFDTARVSLRRSAGSASRDDQANGSTNLIPCADGDDPAAR